MSHPQDRFPPRSPSGPQGGPRRVSSSLQQDDGSGEGRRMPRVDSVESSYERWVLASVHVAGGRPTEAEIGIRIGSGLYNQPEVAEEVARHLLVAGDLNH